MIFHSVLLEGHVMRLAPVVSLGLSVVLGIAAVLIGRGWLMEDDSSQTTQVQPASVELVEVLVARMDLETGDLVDASSIEVAEWPAEHTPRGALGSSADLARHFNGEAFAKGFIAQGEPILQSKLSVEPPRLVLSAGIAPGKRAISIRVTEITGVSGFVLPGDRVDINLIRTEEALRNRVRMDRLESAPTIQPVLSNVLVLGVDQAFSQAMEGAAPSRAVTFEVTPAQARALAAAGHLGQLTLSLIGQEEADSAPEAAFVERPPAPPPRRRTSVSRSRPTVSGSAKIRIIHGASEQEVDTPVAPKETS